LERVVSCGVNEGRISEAGSGRVVERLRGEWCRDICEAVVAIYSETRLLRVVVVCSELDVGEGNRLVPEGIAFELGGSTEVVVHCCLTGERERVLET